MDLLINEQIENLKSKDLYRRLRSQVNISPTRAVIDGKVALLFAGNDYLGLSSHSEIIKAALEAGEKYGTSAGAARLITGNHKLYKQLEEKIAQYKNKQSALVYSSGYMANIGLISALTGPKDVIFMDKLNHASLYDGCKLSGAKLQRYSHNNISRLEELLDEDTCQKTRFIVTDGVFSMDGDLAHLGELKALADKYDCMLIIDDAHGTGVIGAEGKGTAEFYNIELDLEMGTLSKAIGSLGGFIAAGREYIDYLVNKSRPFIFTTGLPPSVLAASICSIKIMQKESWRRERVLELAKKTRVFLERAGFKVVEGFTPIVPVIVGSEEKALKLSNLCLEKGVFIPAIRTPAVAKNQARLRMTLSAIHTDEELEKALDVLGCSAKEIGLIA